MDGKDLILILLHKFIQIAKTASIGFLGALLFILIHTPVPYLLGPMTAILIANRFFTFNLYWPKQLQNSSLIVIGYSLGITFNQTVLKAMMEHIPLMVILTTLLFAISFILALLISKLGEIDYPTALTSSVPGGLTQIVVFAQDMEGIDLSTVTFFHSIRVIMIVFLVPFVVHLPFLQHAHQTESTISKIPTTIDSFNGTHFFVYILLCTIAALLAKRAKIPAPFLLGPIIVTILCNLGHLTPSSLPPYLLNICQLIVGIHIGLLLHPETIKHKTRLFILAITSSMILVTIAFLMDVFIMKEFQHTTLITGFLSLAPGGMDQMGIIAHEVKADVATVTIYQLFRILYIYILIPPVLTLVLRKFQKKSE